MRYLSVCSGIEAASVAWAGLGWQCAGLAEVDPFARAVLAHRYPDVPLHGDFTGLTYEDAPAVDLLVGGTPCQTFSAAGNRAGLDDDRGQLSVEFVRLAERLRVPWIVWENVPAVLSADRGRAFGAIIGAMVDAGYGVAWRVLDAQGFGTAQRRRRVFVVGCLDRSPERAGNVLFEPAGVRGDTGQGRAPGPEIAGDLTCGAGSGGYRLDDGMVRGGHVQLVVFDVQQITNANNRSNPRPGAPTPTLAATAQQAVAFNARQDPCIYGDRCGTLDGFGETHAVGGQWGVRRLTPVEWERLQGFPDDWTLVPWRGKLAPKTRRYKAIGNSMAVPVMRWIGERIQKEQK